MKPLVYGELAPQEAESVTDGASDSPDAETATAVEPPATGAPAGHGLAHVWQPAGQVTWVCQSPPAAEPDASGAAVVAAQEDSPAAEDAAPQESAAVAVDSDQAAEAV